MWGKKCNCEGKWLLLESELKPILLLGQRLEALETSLSSLRGTVNAKLSGETIKKNTTRQKNQQDYRQFTPEEQEFLAGLPEHELERIKNIVSDQE